MDGGPHAAPCAGDGPRAAAGTPRRGMPKPGTQPTGAESSGWRTSFSRRGNGPRRRATRGRRSGHRSGHPLDGERGAPRSPERSAPVRAAADGWCFAPGATMVATGFVAARCWRAAWAVRLTASASGAGSRAMREAAARGRPTVEALTEAAVAGAAGRPAPGCVRRSCSVPALGRPLDGARRVVESAAGKPGSTWCGRTCTVRRPGGDPAEIWARRARP